MELPPPRRGGPGAGGRDALSLPGQDRDGDVCATATFSPTRGSEQGCRSISRSFLRTKEISIKLFSRCSSWPPRAALCCLSHVTCSRLPSDDVRCPDDGVGTPDTAAPLGQLSAQQTGERRERGGRWVALIQAAWRRSGRESPWVSQLGHTRWLGKAELGRTITTNPSCRTQPCPSCSVQSGDICVPVCPGLRYKTVQAAVRFLSL